MKFKVFILKKKKKKFSFLFCFITSLQISILSIKVWVICGGNHSQQMLKLKFFFFFSLDAKTLNVEPLRKVIYIYIYEMGSSYTWYNFTRVTHFVNH